MEMQRRETNKQSDYLPVKVIVIGDSSVGKTALLLRFTNNEFSENTPSSIGASYFTKSLEIEERTVYFQIWDTAGQEHYRSLVPMYLRNARIALLVYDITSMESFLNLEVWRNELCISAPRDVVVAVVGNKSDLDDERKVQPKVGREYARRHNMLFTETSAKIGTNVEEIFYNIGLQMAEPDICHDPNEGRIRVREPETSPLSVKDRMKKCCDL